ncbi:MAG TPA: hypothetical protein VJV23_16740 [Candidatus Polarisedimenticolia bacterium]|nr:hypothetical protein [Candidatus Polarisedimenticolia bacterium]
MPRPVLLAWLASLLALFPAPVPPLPSSPAAQPAERALVTVRTLVIDALGTRTVDTDSARIPFGSKGLLIRRVPYAGPPLSYRLTVLAGSPQPAGIPVTLASEAWAGEVSSPPEEGRLSRREEATVLSSDSSYLLELDHDQRSDRRIVLSISARPLRPGEDLSGSAPGAVAVPVSFLLKVEREVGGVPDPPDERVMSAMVGRPVTYSSGVRLSARAGEPDAGEERMVGLTITLNAEQAQGSLVTVSVHLEGAEFVDQARTRLEPLKSRTIHTVPSGGALEVVVRVPEEQPGEAESAGLRPVRYRVTVIPSL